MGWPLGYSPLAQRIAQGSAPFPPKAEPPLAGRVPNYAANKTNEKPILWQSEEEGICQRLICYFLVGSSVQRIGTFVISGFVSKVFAGVARIALTGDAV